MNYLWIYLAVMAALWWLYLTRRRRVQRKHAQQLRESMEAGLNEPASLHPVIDPQRCLGSSSCIKACPEDALGIVDGKAVLVNGAHCIGHGACRAACPVDAIELVFGTEKRGIDIPNVSPQFESNVPGIFIAGELGGMGLIRKAAEQGRQAMDVIAKRSGGTFEYDVVIVGCGPAGFSAGLSAIEHRLRYKLIEQEESLGGAVFHYPRNKVAMTAPVKLAMIGKVRFGEVPKEKLLEFWQTAVRKTGLLIAFRECMEAIDRDGDGFVVRTSRGSYRTRSVLLTMGRRGTPRKLEVPGEESPKVVYRLIDPAQYAGQAVLVVGGGDSALEAAIALAEQPKTEVTLSYRSKAFSRVKGKNRDEVERLQRDQRLRVELESTVESIEPELVHLKTTGGAVALRNQAVIVCAGGLLPTALLQRIGILFETKHGTA
ncbi:MAG TPA: NAD(P)-binding domain-containing protein [Burkholderiaceae bacterium]|nr:NAD(P)-binding domain-containing protein [Burkholderiaceae bacterium]